jgi:hypothetical protein
LGGSCPEQAHWYEGVGGVPMNVPLSNKCAEMNGIFSAGYPLRLPVTFGNALD